MIRIYCEGQVTEPDYLRIWSRANNAVEIDWGDCGMAPMSLVKRAREDLKRNSRVKKRHGVAEADEVWCVFDTDDHPYLTQAVSEARQSKIKVALSNPCFELWLVLHEEDCMRHVDRRQVQQRAKTLGLLDGKSIPATANDALRKNYQNARKRARALSEMHEDNGSPSGSNPSTDVWCLVERLLS